MSGLTERPLLFLRLISHNDVRVSVASLFIAHVPPQFSHRECSIFFKKNPLITATAPSSLPLLLSCPFHVYVIDILTPTFPTPSPLPPLPGFSVVCHLSFPPFSIHSIRKKMADAAGNTISADGEFVLSATFLGHRGDVRCVAELSPSAVVSGSRDNTCIVWAAATGDGGGGGGSGDIGTTSTLTFKDHEKYIMALCCLPPSSTHPGGLVVTGSLDRTARVWDAVSGATVAYLVGHDNAVCGVSPGPAPGTVATASWDGTARVWSLNDGTCQGVLRGHGASVLAVASHPTSGALVTASADKTLKIWASAATAACADTLLGHTDVVRSIAVLDSDVFASCANDSSVRLWSWQGGPPLAVMLGHNAFVYSLCVLPGDGILQRRLASCGEDGCVKVWSVETGAALQTLQLPCISVWSVAARANGDLVVGSDDGLVRIFTQAAERAGSESERLAFSEQVAAHLAAKQGSVGGLRLADLPLAEEALARPGASNGAVLVVNNKGRMEAHTWDAIKQKWEFQGLVQDAVEPDYTFSIELDGRAMKLHYNKGENPYTVAQAFIVKHELGQHFLDEIANFITTNAETPVLGAAGPRSADPFTSSGGYVPGTGVTTGVGGGGGGGGGGGSGSGSSNASGGLDPFTGGGYRSQPSSTLASGSTAAAPAFAPITEYVSFAASNTADKISAKLEAFNADELAAASGETETALDATELATIQAGLSCIAAGLDDLDGAESAYVNALAKTLTWSTAHLFPALDALRLSLCTGSVRAAASVLPAFADLGAFSAGVAGLDSAASAAAAAANTLAANRLLGLRLLTNLFGANDALFPAPATLATALASLRNIPWSSVSASTYLAGASFALNGATWLARCAAQDKSNPAAEADTLGALDTLLAYTTVNGVAKREEATFRALLAVGTLVLADKPAVLQLVAGTLPLLSQHVNALRSAPDARVAQMAQAVSHLFE